MKKMLSLISLLTLTISNSFAGTIIYSNLNESEKEFIEKNLDNNSIQYDSNTDEVIIDKDLEVFLREHGILSTQDSVGNGVCGGGGGGGGA